MYFPRRTFLVLAAAGVVHLTASRAAAQFDNFWIASPATAANWNVDSNWSVGGVPAFDPFQEIGVINNGGSAFVIDTPPNPGGITLGRVAGGTGNNSGTLEIRAGGNLTAQSGINNTGALLVGQDATGTLNVLGGGQLTAASIASGGAASSINLSGTGQLVSTGSMNLNAVTNLVGQSANLSATQGIVFGGNSRLQIDISGAAAPLIKAGLGVSLGGTLEVDFGGPAPAPGSSWNLLDVGGVAGQFAQVNLASGSLGTGQRLRVRAVADGSSMNGMFGQLVLEQLLVLEIDRDNGTMNIVNPSNSTPIPLDSYAITSSHGSFNPADGIWSSLSDNAVPGWIEANPMPTQLSELDTDGTTTSVSAGSQLSLGTPWNPQFTQLGQNREDVVFRYAAADGEVITAPVIYTGTTVNDIALFVDSMGNAQLRNASNFPVDIEGYSILSPSESLDPVGWESLDSNPDVSDWLEANPSDSALSEFKTDGVETLSSQRALNLGQLFDTGGMQDLVFEYLVDGDSRSTVGRVLYQELPPISAGVLGDYNNDGTVNAADYTLWRDNLGSSASLPNDSTPGSVTTGDYTVWKSNFGATAGVGAGAGVGAAAAVPEPNAALLMIVGMGIGFVCKCGKRLAGRCQF